MKAKRPSARPKAPAKPFDLDAAFRVPSKSLGLEYTLSVAAAAFAFYGIVTFIRWVRQKP